MSSLGEHIIDIIARNNNYDSDCFRAGFVHPKRACLIDSDFSTLNSSDLDDNGSAGA